MNESESAVNDAAWGLRDIETLVRSRPLLVLGVAGVAGAALGALALPRMGRLAFLAVAAYVGQGLWQRQSRLGVESIVAPARRTSRRATPAT